MRNYGSTARFDGHNAAFSSSPAERGEGDRRNGGGGGGCLGCYRFEDAYESFRLEDIGRRKSQDHNPPCREPSVTLSVVTGAMWIVMCCPPIDFDAQMR